MKSYLILGAFLTVVVGCVPVAPKTSAPPKQTGSTPKTPSKCLRNEISRPKKIEKKSPTPRYPSEAKEMEVGGEVALRVTISKEGKVSNVLSVDGPALFKQSALDAVRQWHYTPARCHNHPIAVTMRVIVRFRHR